MPVETVGRTRLIITLIGALLASCSTPADHPPDELLLARFRRHEAAFEMVAEAFTLHPSLERLTAHGPEFASARPRSGRAPGERPDLEPTMAAFRELGSQTVIRRHGGSLGFIVSEDGSGIFESAKGYEYSSDSPGPGFAALDDVMLKCNGEVYYRLIKPGWYLYLQSYCS